MQVMNPTSSSRCLSFESKFESKEVEGAACAWTLIVKSPSCQMELSTSETVMLLKSGAIIQRSVPMPASDLQAAVARYWGYTPFLPLQREAMDAVLAGRDSVVVLPTGGGKSLCFQAPAVVNQGLALIVSPLISLM